MSNYTKTTDFAAKDSLPSGDSGKIIRGSEFETEFDNISTAIATKSDTASPTFTGTVTIPTLSVTGNTTLGNAATDTVTVTADIASNLIPSADDTYNLGASGAEWNDLYVDGTAHIDAINFNGTDITATAAELNIMDGVTATTAELNIMDGVTATTAELNLLDGVTATTTELNRLDVTTLGTVEAAKVVTADSNADVTFSDGDKVKFGTGTDFEIQHNGTVTRLQAIQDHNIEIRNFNTVTSTDVKDVLNLVTNSAGSGGAGYRSGLAIRHTDDDDKKVRILAEQANDFSNAMHMILQTSENNTTQPSDVIKLHSNGDVGFFEDTGTTEKLFWDASAERLGIGTTSPSNTLTVSSGVTDVAARFTSTDSISLIEFVDDATTSNPKLGGRGNDLTFFTAGAERLRLNSSGSLGLGTGNPQQRLHVDDGGIQVRADTGIGQLSLISKNNVTSAGQKITFMGANRDDANEEYASIQGLMQSNQGGSGNVQTGHLRFSTSGSERMRIAHTGEVCIGRTDGEASLDIAGTRRLANGNVTTGSKVLTEFNFTVSNTGSNEGDTWLLAATIELETGNYKAALFEYTISDPNSNFGNSNTLENYTGLIRLTRTQSTTQDDPYDAAIYGPTMAGPDIQVYKNSAGKYEIQVKHTGSNQFAAFNFRLLSGSPIITLPANGSTAATYAGLASSTGGTAYTRTQNATLGSRQYMDIGSANVSDGIFFGGAATANKLDDYEEGTWSPTISGVNGLTVGASPSYSATYTKIGRLVYFTVLLDFDSTDTVDVGDRVLVSNLPFTRDGAIETITGVGTAVIYNSYGSNVLAQGTVGLDSSTVISVVITNVSGSPTHASNTRLSGTYIAA